MSSKDSLIPNFDKFITDEWFPTRIQVFRNNKSSEIEGFKLNIKKRHKIFDTDAENFRIVYFPIYKLTTLESGLIEASQTITFNTNNFEEVKKLVTSLCGQSGAIAQGVYKKIKEIELNKTEKIVKLKVDDEPMRNIIFIEE